MEYRDLWINKDGQKYVSPNSKKLPQHHCHKCGKGFAENQDLITHIKSVHLELLEPTEAEVESTEAIEAESLSTIIESNSQTEVKIETAL